MAWIRSQDGSMLLNVSAVWQYNLDKRELRAETFPAGDDVPCWIIGKFDDEKAAREELDCIDDWFNKGGEGVYQV